MHSLEDCWDGGQSACWLAVDCSGLDDRTEPHLVKFCVVLFYVQLDVFFVLNWFLNSMV